MIRLSTPSVLTDNGKSRMAVDIDIDGQKSNLWFEVDDHYGQYLCSERSDAFVVGLLNYAMRHGHDIYCSAPVGEDLYYQITHYLIDALVKGSRGPEETRLKHIDIHAAIDSDIPPSAGAVGTGMSCGVDSLHALSKHIGTKFARHNITHLTFHNVGGHGAGEVMRALLPDRLKHTEAFCQKEGFELISSTSNIMDVVTQHFGVAHTYLDCFAVLALQRLFSIFYYASGVSFADFTMANPARPRCARPQPKRDRM